MRKWIVLAGLVLLFAWAAPLSAHTGIKTASPAKSEITTEPVDEIFITFNTGIEPLSKITLVNEQGEALSFAEVLVGADSIQGTLPEPLENGVYTVEWRIIGADGHAVQGDYSFTVQLPEPEDAAEAAEDENAAVNTPETPTEQSDSEPEAAPTEEEAADQPSNEVNPITADTPESKRDSSLWIGGVVAIVIAAIIADRVIRLRKRK